jgi:hypothetical protein
MPRLVTVENKLIFGIPALVIRIFLYAGIPFLLRAGIQMFEAWFICTIIPLGLLVIAAIVAYRLETPFFTREAFQERFRLNSLHGKAWLWFAGGFLVAFLVSRSGSKIPGRGSFCILSSMGLF